MKNKNNVTIYMEKIKENLSFSVLRLDEAAIPDYEEKIDGRKDYISYGSDNKFPQYIYELFLHSALMESIIRGTSDYVMGNDITVNEAIEGFSKMVNKDFQTLTDIIEKAIMDYLIFDGFAIHVFRDADGKINELYNLDFQNCRISQDEKYILYCSKWDDYKCKPNKYDRFDMNKPKRNSILYFKGKTAQQTQVYPIPSYYGALNDIRTSTEISNFHLNSILNDFNSNCIISFNSGSVDEETKKKVEKQFKEKFTGSRNAGKFLLAFNESKDNAVTVERLASDDFDKRYEALSKTITENIFVAFRCSPQLMGMTTATSGFNTQEYQEAFKLYNKTVVKPIQLVIQRVFDRLFGIEDSIKFVPFSLEPTVESTPAVQ